MPDLFNFDKFIAPKMIKSWAISSAFLFLGVVMVLGAFAWKSASVPGAETSESLQAVLLVWFFGAVLFIPFWIWLRICCDFILVIFRIHDHLEALRNRKT